MLMYRQQVGSLERFPDPAHQRLGLCWHLKNSEYLLFYQLKCKK
jgi:hypothetical protein